MTTDAKKFASLKARREFVEWLKIEAAKARVPMYEYLELMRAKWPKPRRRLKDL